MLLTMCVNETERERDEERAKWTAENISPPSSGQCKISISGSGGSYYKWSDPLLYGYSAAACSTLIDGDWI
jgi:hypothetical protein